MSEKSPQEEEKTITKEEKNEEEKTKNTEDEKRNNEKNKNTIIEQWLKDLESNDLRKINNAIKKLGRITAPNVRQRLMEIARGVNLPRLRTRNDSWIERIRINAIEGLAMGGKDETFRDLCISLYRKEKNKDKIRRTCITQLAQYRDKNLIPLFIDALKDKYDFVRLWALRGLTKIHDPKAKAAIVQCLGDENELIRKEAANHLIGERKEIIPHLVKAYKNKDANKFMRFGTIGVLGRLNEPEAVEPLIAALKDGNDRIVSIAIRGLGRLGYLQAIKPLIQLLRKDKTKKNQILNALIKIGRRNTQGFIRILASELDLEDEETKEIVKEVLTRLMPESMVSVIDLLEYKNINDETKENLKVFLELFS